MKITLLPVSRDESLTVYKVGDTLTINGEAFDFSVIPEGATLPGTAINSPWIFGDISRVDGQLSLMIFLPHGANATEEQRFPAAIIDPPDGELNLPKDPAPEQEVAQ